MHGVPERIFVWRQGLHRLLVRSYPGMDDLRNYSFFRKHVYSIGESHGFNVTGRRDLEFNIQKKGHKECQNFRIHYSA